ncbi:MAG TPA: hypothetical protein VMM12_16795 [Longimicrobiales bacterium]|nr:hypothetical protein [Longimicrobiales bacterium]
MIRAPRCTLAAAIGLLAAACATTGQAVDPAALAGCYYFEQDQVAAELRLPWGFRLLDQALTGWPALQPLEGVRVATTLTGRDETDHPFGYWRPLPGDSILVGYPAGGGFSLHLAPAGAGMTGTIRALGDATLATARPARPVRIIHARCPEDL